MVFDDSQHEGWRKAAIDLIACYLRVLNLSTHAHDAQLAAFYFTEAVLSCVDYSLEMYLKGYYQEAVLMGMWNEAVSRVHEPITDKINVENYARAAKQL